MHSISCSQCHLPAMSGRDSVFNCCFGCELLGSFRGPNKRLWIARVSFSIFLYFLILILKHFADYFARFDAQQILWVLFVLSTGMMLLIGLPLLIYTISSLRLGRWMASEALMVLAILVDYGHSFHLTLFGWHSLQEAYPRDYFPFYYTGLFLLVTYAVSAFEGFFRQGSHKNLDAVLQLRPSMATRLLAKTGEEKVRPGQLQIGDLVLIQAGEIIPCDGEIISGASSVDESEFFGTKSIFFKKKTDWVIAGSMNRDGPLKVEVKRLASQSFLEQLIASMRHAIATPPRIQNAMEKGFPYIIFFVFIFGLGTYFHYGMSGSPTGLLNALSIVVFMGFFTILRIAPIIVTIAVGHLARSGVFLRSGEIFKNLSQMDSIFFDKTGTLTQANFKYSSFFLEKGNNQGLALSMLFSLEAGCDHPLAHGMQTHPWYREIPKYRVENLKNHPGLGVCGNVIDSRGKKRFVAVGNQRFLKRFQMQVSRAMREKLEQLELLGETAVLCGYEHSARGLISFSDTLKPDVNPLLKMLQKLKVIPMMITGDHDELVAHLSFSQGLKQSYTRCLPDEKAKKIKNSKDRGEIVGMVSNFIQDETAIQNADVNMVLGTGTGYTDQPWIHVAVLGGRLLHISDLISYSRRAYRTLKFSFILSLIYGAGGLTLGALGLLSPMGALVSMAASSILLISFPMRLKRVRFGVTTA